MPALRSGDAKDKRIELDSHDHGTTPRDRYEAYHKRLSCYIRCEESVVGILARCTDFCAMTLPIFRRIAGLLNPHLTGLFSLVSTVVVRLTLYGAA